MPPNQARNVPVRGGPEAPQNATLHNEDSKLVEVDGQFGLVIAVAPVTLASRLGSISVCVTQPLPGVGVTPGVGVGDGDGVGVGVGTTVGVGLGVGTPAHNVQVLGVMTSENRRIDPVSIPAVSLTFNVQVPFGF